MVQEEKTITQASTLNSIRYRQVDDLDCPQENRLKEAIALKRPVLANRMRIVVHYDNARNAIGMTSYQVITICAWRIKRMSKFSW